MNFLKVPISYGKTIKSKLFNKHILFGSFVAFASYEIYKKKDDIFGLDKKFQLFSWGAGLSGQLGLGIEHQGISLPRKIELPSDKKIIYITAGNDFSIVITEDYKLYCWGRTKGILKSERGYTNNLMVPTLITELEKYNFKQASCGKTHIAAVTIDGKVMCWGNPSMGKLGFEEQKLSKKESNFRDYQPLNYSDKAVLGQVTGVLESVKVKQVSCGFHHTLALSEDGKVYSWGQGKEGALGLGNWEQKGNPQLIPNLSDVIKIGCGSEYSICLTSKGELYAWGRNNYGQLGISGNASIKINKPGKITLPRSDIQIKDFSCGEEHSAFVSTKGEIFTWGFGNEGQLGHSTKNQLNMPKHIENFNQKSDKVVCGGGHTAIITDSKKLFLFGRGRDGQLGRGDKTESISVSRYDPQSVEFFNDHNIKIEEIALGANHTIALTD